MKDYTTDAPLYSESIPIVEETDLVNAENNNAAPKQLLQNDLVIRALIGALTQQLESNAQAAKDYTDGAYQQSTGYTDKKIADLINGAPTTLDTLGEIAKAMAENESVVEALHESIGKKVNYAEMESWLGLKLDKTGDSGSTTANYTSDDTETPSGWKNFTLFTGLEKVKEIFSKISTMASDLRWLHEQYNSLNSNMTSKTFTPDRFDTPEEFDKFLSTISADMPNYTWYRRYAGCSTNHPIFGGISYYIEGTKQSDSYEWQEARGYSDESTVRWFFRVKYLGNWGPWMRVNVTTVG